MEQYTIQAALLLGFVLAGTVLAGDTTTPNYTQEIELEDGKGFQLHTDKPVPAEEAWRRVGGALAATEVGWGP